MTIEELYTVFQGPTRRIILSALGPKDVDDRVHDCFLIVLRAIRAGEIRQPERLMGFVKTVVRRYIIREIHAAVDRRKRMVNCDVSLIPVRDRSESHEQTLIAKQRMKLARSVFSGASVVDRDVLLRFYVHEQPKEQICREMSLTSGQFNMLKTRAKARVAEKYREVAA